MSKADKLQEIINFFELREGYSKNEIIADMLGKIKELKGHAADEIALVWDEEEGDLMVLNDFVDVFYEKVIEGVSNVLKSYQKQTQSYCPYCGEKL